ncbi:MAG TPA: O-antigen ligase family protein [Gemmatimonadales bacterium]|nr:O-antigen ligase family protein [Gemmatimonadales bacterium]
MTVASIPRSAGRVAPLVRPATPPAAIVRTRSIVNPIVRAAFYLFVLSIPFEMPTRTTLPIEIPTLVGVIFLLATLIQPSEAYRRIPGALLWFVAYMWMFGLSTFVNRGDHHELIAIQFLSHLELLFILWAGANILRDRKVMRGALLALAFAVTIRAGMQILGIATTATPLWTGGVRMTVFGQNPNLSAIIMSAGLVTLLNLRPRLLAWPLAAMIGFAIVQTGSRGGLACAAVGMLALLWQGRTAWVRVRSVLVGLAALGLLAFGAWQSDMFRTRLTAASEGSLAGRERIYPATIEMISERPLLGWGPTENQYEIARRMGEDKKEHRDAHNIVLELLSATGVLGAIPFLIGLGLCVVAAWRARRGSFHMLPFALLVTVLTGTISGTWIASKILWLAFAIVVASGEVVRQVEQRRCAA